MKSQLKPSAKATVRFVVSLTSRTRFGRYLQNETVNTAIGKVTEVSHSGMKFQFAIPNPVCEWRAKPFLQKKLKRSNGSTHFPRTPCSGTLAPTLVFIRYMLPRNATLVSRRSNLRYSTSNGSLATSS